MTKKLGIVLTLAITTLLGLVAYRLVRSHVADDIYRERLQEANERYARLASTYNDAVKKTAVTELIVYEDGSVCVAFVNEDGTEEIKQTPFKMGSVVYVDFIVEGNKAFFHRVFDEDTPPREALVINPMEKTFEWRDGVRGKATFTKLKEPGRWTVTLTGGGSLDIARKPEGEQPTHLMPPPDVKDYAEIEAELNERINEITPGDVFERVKLWFSATDS